MNLPISILKRVGILNKGAVELDLTITKVFIDSREKVNNGLFIPIVGDRFDGHDFLEQAIENGASACLWQRDRTLPATIPDLFPIFFVDDSLTALQKLAKLYLQHVDPMVVAITGSNGKTTTKDIVASIVSQSYQTFQTQGNLNNHIGVPLTILSMSDDSEVLILEMGMNEFGEISLLSKLAQPDMAIITNIGESHLEQLGSRAGIAKAKQEILDGLVPDGLVIYDGDEPLLAHLKENEHSVACGYETNCNLHITVTASNECGQSFRVNKKNPLFYIPLLGKHNIKNSCFAIAVGKQLRVSDDEIQQGLRHLQLTNMRLERLQGPNGSLLINDAYNASPVSMKAGIETIASLSGYAQKVLVLGDMYELGANEETLHREIAEAINDQIYTVICVGSKAKWIGEALQDKGWLGSLIFCKSKEVAEQVITPLFTPQTVVYFKASRGVQLETVIKKVIRR